MIRIRIKLMFWSFQSNKRQKKSENPKVDHYLNEEKSDVVFVVEDKTIPAVKSFLSIKSKVFRAMFSGDFKESKEIVIENISYEAFNAFIRFLYCDHLDVKYDNDFELIRKLYRLCDRYGVSRLELRMTNELIKNNSKLFNGPKSESNDDFQKKWQTIGSIARIAFESQISRLTENVMTFIDTNFDHFLKKDIKEMNELNDFSDGQLFQLMAKKCRKAFEENNELKKCLTNDQKNKYKIVAKNRRFSR